MARLGNPRVILTAILADDTNLGLTRIDETCALMTQGIDAIPANDEG